MHALKVVWMKGTRKIEPRNDANYIISNEGFSSTSEIPIPLRILITFILFNFTNKLN